VAAGDLPVTVKQLAIPTWLFRVGTAALIMFALVILTIDDLQLFPRFMSFYGVLLTVDYWRELLIKPLLLILVLMLVEARVVGWKKCSIRRLMRPSKSSRVDIATFMLSILRLTPLFEVIFTLGVVLLIRKALPSLPTLDLAISIDNLLVQGAIGYVARDFATYWIHRLSHQVGFLWEAHKLHHSATEFNLLSLNRLHPIDLAYRSVSRGFLFALLGLSLQAFPLLIMVERVFDRINHSNFTWRYGWVGKWILYSPHGHRIHHSVDPIHLNKNFGETSPIWDRIFGTWCDEQKNSEEIEIGIPNNCFNQNGFLHDYWLCFENSMRALGKTCSTFTPSSLNQ
jgi:sterol desaturase/sphingolipid hydroxylase (fatty acid hydroxylase superfamily)